MDSGKKILIPTKRTVTVGGPKAGPTTEFDLYVDDVKFCPLCGLEGPHRKRMGIREEMSQLDFHPTAIYAFCERCGFLFQTPTMDDKSLELFYQHVYRPNLNGTLLPTTGDFSHEVVRGASLLTLMDEYGIVPSRMMDVGTSLGMFPIMAREKYNCRIVGVEMDRDRVGMLIRRGVPCYTDLSQVPGEFDFITAIHLLEHCPRPLEVLAEIRKRLQIGGKLLIQVPISWGGGHAGVLKFWHPTVFSPKTLRIMVESAGFRVVRTRISGGVRFRYPVMEDLVATLDENAPDAGWTGEREVLVFPKFILWDKYYLMWDKIRKHPLGSRLTDKDMDKQWAKWKDQLPLDWKTVREHPTKAELWGEDILFGTIDDEETVTKGS